MRSLIRETPKTFATLTLLAVGLRLLFVLHWPVMQGDALIYIALAKNMLSDHIYGLARAGVGIVPTVIRLPGYPLFIAACFKVFGVGNTTAVMLVQAALDVATCFVVAETARRTISDRAARIAFGLACLCPFTANYAGTMLTETTEIFSTALAVLLAAIAMEKRSLPAWAGCGLATAAAIQLRPDGGLVLIALMLVIAWKWYRDPADRPHSALAVAVLCAVSLAPLVPWTIRNWRTLHIFQPLVTMEASDPDEFVPRGWNKWVNTWIADYSSTEDLTFNVSGTAIDLYALPDWAFDSPQEFERVARLFAEYNKTLTMTPEIDQEFGEIARQRIRSHPIRQFLVLPAVRVADLWLRPRTEMLPLDTHWWEFDDDLNDSSIASALGVANLLLILCAIAGAARGNIRYIGLLTLYPILRTLLLVKMAAVEDRYTLECFPMLFVLAAAYLAQRKGRLANEAAETIQAS